MNNQKRFLTRIASVVAIWFLISGTAFAQTGASGDAKQLWQLLDYVAVDYSGAVADGVIISEAEYAEMLDFTENAGSLLQSLPEHVSKPAIAQKIAELRAAVLRKEASAEVSRLANQANSSLITAYPFPVAPATVPELARGQTLYAAQCAACHGVDGKGDGPLAESLEPKPIAFTDAERARTRSLMALYQVISQGVEGTSMASFEALPEADRWALAFYIGTLSYDESMREEGKQFWNNDGQIKSHFADLTMLTTITEAALAETIQEHKARAVTAYLRNNPDVVEKNKPVGLALSRLRLAESLAAARAGDRNLATRLSLSAYLDGFEPLEPIVATRDGALMIAVETAMLTYRSAITKGTIEQAETAAVQLEQLFVQVDALMQEAKADPTTTFVGALTILLREGIEALLIVIGMITFLKKTDRPEVLRHVHRGWISALLAGVLTWVVATYLIGISGANREVTEGIGSVLAAVVLLSVGLWMHQKSSAGKWQDYLKGKMSKAVSQGSAWALFALAFIAVYREVFETVLFYSALAADGNGGALMAGFFTALVLLIIIAWALLRTSARMPLGTFFSFTSILVVVLAVVLIGKGVSALQEAGWIGVTLITIPRIEWLGLYPTLETFISQIIVAFVAAGGFGWSWFKTRNNTIK
ncbi:MULTISPECIES: cytochrome c/FTR1 family iron permease [Cellvibrio]|uniref:High-affinity iron transporter n=1 Tax=Cellvibrio fibrivorans TaxID=126350 RepID=A0ABU1V3U3_9GAMM|nr:MULTISPECIES: cytochrome c/FTR1 family iron permease [Cellvibrio]MDR7092144.1 high-affinity iron transporter [Cellvibrio fibrivorans]UUA74429.1 cytochrome c/FTR1 family iron permease [Cellvibrio sp. QJXJ]